MPTVLVAIAALGGVLAAACSHADDAPDLVSWEADGVMFRYPDNLASGEVEFVEGTPATGCLCHVATGTSGGWTAVRVESLQFRDDPATGLRLRVIDTSADESLAELAADGELPDTAVKDVAERLAVPVGTDALAGYRLTRTRVAGLPSVLLDAGELPTADGSVTRQDWIVFHLQQARLYAITCQFTADHAEEMGAACREAVESFRITGAS